MSTIPATSSSAEGLAPGAIEPTETREFTSADGTGLYGEWFEAKSPRGLALVVHGYAEHCGRYREVANVLTGAGLSTFTYDMRGHGRAEGQRGHVDGYRQYLADLDAAHQQLRDLGGESSILLVTHSNGGLIGLRSLADPTRHLPGVDSAILSSPFLGLKVKVPLWKDVVGRAAGRFAPRLSLPSELSIDDLTHDRDKLDERRVDTLCHEVASARWFTAALHSHEYVYELAHRVTLPTLWLVAEDDRIADPSAARAVHARLRAPSRLHMLPGMFHEVFNEVDRGRVFDLVRGWIAERFPS